MKEEYNLQKSLIKQKKYKDYVIFFATKEITLYYCNRKKEYYEKIEFGYANDFESAGSQEV